MNFCVIGLGTVGSSIIKCIKNIEINKIILIDPDKIEKHNI